jgi:hypothetical protein
MTDAFRFEAELHWTEGNIAEVISTTKREIASLTATGIKSGTGASEGTAIIQKVLAAEKAIDTAKKQGDITSQQALRSRLDLTKRIKDLSKEAEAAGKGLLAEQLRTVSTSQQRLAKIKSSERSGRAVEPATTVPQRQEANRRVQEAKAAAKAEEDATKLKAKAQANAARAQAKAESDQQRAIAKNDEAKLKSDVAAAKEREKAAAKTKRQEERQATIAARAAQKEEADKPENRAQAVREGLQDNNAVRRENLNPQNIDEYVAALADATKLRTEETQWVKLVLSGEKDYIESLGALSQIRKEIAARSALVESGRNPDEVMQLSGNELLAQAAAARKQDNDALQKHTFDILSDSREAIESARDRRASKATFEAQVTSGQQVIQADAALTRAKRDAAAKQNLVLAGRPDIAFSANISGDRLAAESAAATAGRNAALTTEKNTILKSSRASIEGLAAKEVSNKELRAEINSTKEVVKANADYGRAQKEAAARSTLYLAGNANAFSANVSGDALIAQGAVAQGQLADASKAAANALKLETPEAIEAAANAQASNKEVKASIGATKRATEADAKYADAQEARRARIALQREGVSDVTSLTDEQAILHAGVLKRAKSEFQRAEVNASISDDELGIVAKYRTKAEQLNAATDKRTAAANLATTSDKKTSAFQRLLSKFSPQGKPAEDQPKFGQFLGQKAVTSGGYMLSGALIAGLSAGIIQTMKDASELEYTFVRIKGQLEGLGEGDEFGDLRETIKGIAIESGQSAKEVGAFMSRVLGIFGDVDTAAQQTRAAMRLAVVASVELESVQQDLIPIMKSFDVGAEEIGDTVVGMRDKFGIAEESSLSFLGKTAVVAEQAGFKMRELEIIGGYMANSLGKDLGASADVLNKLPSLMESNQGKIYSILNRNPNTRSFVDPMMKAFGSGEAGKAFTTLIKAMGSMDEKQKQAILTSVVSRREAEELNAVLANSEQITADLADTTVLGADSAGKLNARFHSMSDTVKHTFESLGAAADNFGESLFKLGIADSFINVGKAAGGLLTIISALATGLEKIDDIVSNIIPFKEVFGSGPLASMIQFLGTVFLISKGLGIFNKVRKEGIGGSAKAAIAEAVEAGTRKANAAAATVEGEAIEKTNIVKTRKPAPPGAKKKAAPVEEEDFTKGLEEQRAKERRLKEIKDIADAQDRERGKKPPPLPPRPGAAGAAGAEDTSGRKPPPLPRRPSTEGRPPPPTAAQPGPPPLPRRPGAPAADAFAAEQKRSKGLFRRRGGDDTADALDADSAARKRNAKANRDSTKSVSDLTKAQKGSELQYGLSLKQENRASAAHQAEARRRNDAGEAPPPGFGGGWTPGMVAAQEADDEKSAKRAAKNKATAESGGKAAREGRVLKSGGKLSKGLSAIGFDPASIALTGAVMTVEAWQTQKTGLDEQVEKAKANMSKMSTQQLGEIAKQENDWKDNLSSFLFNIDLPNKLAEFEKRIKEGGESRKTVLALAKQTPAKLKSSPDAYGKTKTLADLFAKTLDDSQVGRLEDFFKEGQARADLAGELGIAVEQKGVQDPTKGPGFLKFVNSVKLSREKIAELPGKVADLTKEGKNEEAKNLQNLLDSLTKDPNMAGLRDAINKISDTGKINEMVNSLGAEDFVGAGFQELEELYDSGKIGTKQMMDLYQQAISDKEKQVKLIEDPTKREAAYAELNKFRKRYEEFDKIAMDREIKNITGISNISGTHTPVGDELRAKLRVLPGHKFETQATQYADLLQQTSDAFNEDTDKIADAVKRSQVRAQGFDIDPAIRRLRFAADPEASAVMSGLKDLTNQGAEYYSDFIQTEMDRTGQDATTVMLAYLDNIIGIIAEYEPEGETIKKYKALRAATAAGAFNVPDPGKKGETDKFQNTVDGINADADRWKAQLSRRKSEVAADPLATAILGRDEARAEVARLERLKKEAPDAYNPDDMEKAIAGENDANRQIQAAEDAIVDAKLGWAEVLANGDPVRENAARMVLAKEKLRRAIRDHNQAAIDQAGQDIERLNQEAVDNNNDIVSARANVAKALIEDDPVKAALAGLQQAQFAEGIAKGEAARLNAQAERIRAEKGLEEAINENFASRVNLLQALANAAGHPVEASRLALGEEQRQLSRLLGKGLAMDSTPVQDQLGKVATATRNFLDTDVAEQTDLIDFALEMRQITVAQAIAGYRVQQARYAKDDRAWRDLERKIQSLQGQGADDLQFNLPSTLGLPTLYESRRMNQSNGMGIGYQDNRNTVVTIAVNGSQDPMAVAGQVMAAFQSATKAPSTFSGAVSTGV